MDTFAIISAQIENLCRLYPEFADDLRDVLNYADSKPDIALFKLRRILEAVVEAAYVRFTGRALPDDTSPSALLAEPALASQVPSTVLNMMYALKRSGNRAVHRRSVTSADARTGLVYVCGVLEWSSRWWAGGPTAT